MIKVIDDFLPWNVALKFQQTFFDAMSWKPYWNKHLNETNTDAWNWHTAVGNDTVNIGQIDEKRFPVELDVLNLLWEQTHKAIVDIQQVNHKMDRWYANSHTFGQEGPIHRDDGSLTCLYYPTKDWIIDWEGGTSFYNEDIDDCIKYASYKFNRMIIFDSNIPHRAMPVARNAYTLRTSVVFKTSMDITHPSYIDWYNKQ
jgi:hypothetical protein